MADEHEELRRKRPLSPRLLLSMVWGLVLMLVVYIGGMAAAIFRA